METNVETAVEPLVVEEVEEVAQSPAPAAPEKCSSVHPGGVLVCELDVHPKEVVHQFSWTTTNGPQIQYWR